jgi:tetratricopeptide (TPR) repeat protein
MFDPENPIVKLCAAGMMLEGEAKPVEAHKLFMQAWGEATNDFERMTAAHYVARHQDSVELKLKWDLIALDAAVLANDKSAEAAFPSLYLNVAKCYEDLNDFNEAAKYYNHALDAASALPDDGYSNMIKAGIANGLKRISDDL